MLGFDRNFAEPYAFVGRQLGLTVENDGFDGHVLPRVPLVRD
jgi:hypothetical protein